MKQLLSACSNAAKHTSYLNKALSKASELGLIEHINPNTLRAPFKPQALPNKINQREIGLILSDGTIKFQSEEQAIAFGKKKIMSGLHQDVPIEVNVEIGKGGRVLGVNKGQYDSVEPVFKLHPELARDAYISMHGHPEWAVANIGTGYATAISTPDYEHFIKYKIKKMIVYNSKGEYYEMVKSPKFKSKMPRKKLLDALDRDLENIEVKGMMDETVFGSCTRLDILKEAQFLENEIKKFDKMTNKKGFKDWENLDAKAKKVYEESCDRTGIYAPVSEPLYYDKCFSRKCYLRSILNNDVDFYIARSHELWQQLGPKYGVQTKTNFHHFVG